jgi:murein L,D-transpeptidase YcbB/YkuD
VYIHDTPSRGLFEKQERCFSSGCIRIEKPDDLSEFVLQYNPKWTRQAIIAAIEKGEQRVVRLPEPIPVHLVYLTAWVNEGGKINFRNDIYERDKPLYEALKQSPPDITNLNKRWCNKMIIRKNRKSGFLEWIENILKNQTFSLIQGKEASIPG